MPFKSIFKNSSAIAALVLSSLPQFAHAGITDLANVPLFTSSATSVKSNILFILDNSGSMGWDYLPDDVPRSNGNKASYGSLAAQCNGVQYNSAINYLLPVDAAGVPYPNASFTAARNDGFSASSSTVNLTNRYYYDYTPTAAASQPAMSYTYSAKGLDTTSAFYAQCNSLEGSAPGSAVFTKVVMTALSPQQQNYANWYSYYRTRILMMKSSVGLAFAPVDAKYRIGYNTISNASASGANFLDVKDFDAAQKLSFYAKLYAANPGNSTPLRGAISHAGQYFAHKAPGQTLDPMQYSCQKNFTILSTDGYWNTGDETSSYGPYQLDNRTAVGEQDGAPTARPMFDGGAKTASSNSLADVAMYYYMTDLRTAALANCTGVLGVDVCANNVPGVGRDSATYQHMTTFTLGLGVSGTLKSDPNYLSQTSGDYIDILNGIKDWPAPDGNAANVDDLWHAAVDGRGQYFSAKEPKTLALGLSSALDAIKAATGSGAAAGSSSLQPVAGNNDIFVAQFTSQKWTGDVLSYTLDPTTGAVSTKLTWSAQAQLDLLLPAARKIYYANSGQPRSLSDFSYTNLTTDGLATNFDNFCNKIGAGGTSAPTQCAAFSAADVLAANAGANLVSYLRGSKFDTLYRTRDHVLGDIVNAAPLFVGKPAFKYSENGYGNFASASSRSDVVYVAANDGMLHALDRLSGNEKWAYIPSFVIPDLYKLADQNYPNNHAPRVDAAPVMGDIFTATGWKTILVGGLNGGGRGYYALDVTDSANPKLLWEFSDADLGLSFGNPVISKQNDGTWVVIFSSGYNNINPGDGNGHLYVLNANSGAQILKIATLVGSATVGSTATPSGLAKINAYIVSELDNTAQAVYGGDLLGNVWRFDINSTINPFLSALRLAELKVGTTVQPITTKPALAEVNSLGAKYKVVYIGTGKYLGTTDLANTGTQSIYALKDDWTATGLGDVRAGGNMVVQSATIAGGTLSVTSNPVAWASKSGWYLDLITPGERVNVNPLLVLNSLYVATSVPSTDACAAGGSSWLYKLDIASGKGAAEDVPNALVSGLTAFKVGANIDLLLTLSDGTIVEKKGDPIPTSGSLGRTSWRVLK